MEKIVFLTSMLFYLAMEKTLNNQLFDQIFN